MYGDHNPEVNKTSPRLQECPRDTLKGWLAEMQFFFFNVSNRYST